MDSRSVSQPPTDQNDDPAALLTGTATSPQDASATAIAAEESDAGIAPAENVTGLETQEPESRKSGPSGETDGLEPVLNAYGTRSRNRSSKINYAEDQDLDIDGPSPPVKVASAKNASSNDAKRSNPQAASDAKSGVSDSTFTRLVSVNGSDQPEKSPSSGKDPAPSNPTKKRKVQANAISNSAALVEPATKRTGPNPGYIPPANMTNVPNMLFFEKSKAVLRKGSLVADDGTVLNIDDHVYLVCEPPGDPYYLCRIMEFLHTDSEDPKSPVDSMRVNWFYRPRDVQRLNSDTRLVYGTMHSDVCPLTSLRGKCVIMHRSEISNLDEYRKGKDCFWYSQIFDRFIRRFYELIPTSEIINVPDKVKKALDERWKFIAVEMGRVKELTSAVKLCKRCSQYCASNDSVDCAICHNAYHMNCVRPPLPKKPTRGFAWACGPCSRAQEKRLEARQTPVLGQSASATEEDEVMEEEEEDPAQAASTRAPTPSSDIIIDQHPGTQAEIAMAKMWPFRYLGIHCRVEDALQYDDRAIYPRASSRLGPRHQANVNVWHGRPVELVKPAEIKKRYVKNSSHKKDGKLSKETLAAIEADRAEKAKRPKWVQDEPPGYVHRGEDYPNEDPRNTSQLLFRMPIEDELLPKEGDHSAAADEAFIDDYMQRAKALAKTIRVADYGSNLLDKALQLLMDENYDAAKALKRLAKVDRSRDLKEPILTQDELKKFEDGVSKYGSEHRSIRLHMKTSLPTSTIVRFYYLWKKTPRGRQIWDHYGGRKGKKRQNMDAAAKMQAEVADDVDDSAFDTTKAEKHKRGFQCKFCSTKHSRQWRRAPGVTAGQTVPADGKGGKEKGNRLLLAVCGRCAGLWRRYAIQYEDLDEATRKAAQNGGRGLKRRIDEELLREVLAAHETPLAGTPEAANVALPSIETNEPPKKKVKTAVEEKKKEKPPPPPKLPTPPPPPIIPEEPRWRDLPCAVCKVLTATGEMPISCHHCKLTVHKKCYGLAEQVLSPKWVCDQCSNDRNPVVSTDYACTLCTVEETVQELLEPPRVSHKKKTDREREKERMEKELAEKFKADYRNRQRELNRPIMPREPLKRTDGNNWVHILCAAWTPELRFSNATTLERAEGFSAIPMERYEATCKLCKSNKHGACVSCQQCKANFHVGCAAQAGYIFGFDVTPVKGSRKDQVTTVTLANETGALAAVIWCKDHPVKTVVHQISEDADDSGRTALQVFVESYKQADQTLTGTARKANLLSQSTKLPVQPASASVAANRRVSMASNAARGQRNSSAGLSRAEDMEGASPQTEPHMDSAERKCITCAIDVSPKWWLVPEQSPHSPQTHAINRAQDVQMTDVVNGVPHVNSLSIKEERPNGDVPPVAQLGLDEESQPQQYCCHKCHWKSINNPEPEVVEQKPPSPSPPTSSLPAQPGWGGAGAAGSLPTLSSQFSQQPVSITNTSEAQRDIRIGSHGPVVQASHTVYPQTNGFVSAPAAPHSNGLNGYSQPIHSVGPQFPPAREQPSPHPQAPPPPMYAQVNGQGLPPHHRQQTLPNGRPLASPTYLGAGMPPQAQQYAATRTSESPFGIPPPQAQVMNGQHGSPPNNFARPATPRDGSVDTRAGANAGASASPNLRNLLH